MMMHEMALKMLKSVKEVYEVFSGAHLNEKLLPSPLV